ncbi:hypothetical protein E3E36_07540 [Thermococcus sp. M36]|uniref:hypothetical protein n=1 Tax=Thermococcus sp. M36 TaxID=1638261 RepID=UPI00143C4A02|nr:hypothetical protein [Thermococcus sp. M36]NJE05996.1 hypothetical protein [Thermococcus sp. M36]
MPDDVYQEALRLASNIHDRYLRAITYSKIGYYMYLAKKPGYKTAFKYAFNVIGAIDNPLVGVRALMGVGAYLHRTNPQVARKVFSQAHETILGFPDPLRDELLSELVMKALELGSVDDALFYASDIEDSTKRNDFLLRVLGAYLERGNMRKAHLLLRRITDEPWRSVAIVETIKWHLKREEFGSSIRLLSELRDGNWLSEAMREVAVHLKGADVPRETYEKFVDIALTLSTEHGMEALESLLVGLGSQGEIDFVMDMLRKIPPARRLSVLKGIVTSAADREGVMLKLVESLGGRELDEVSAFIIDKLLSFPADRKYLGLVLRIGERSVNDAVLVKVTTYLARLGELETAWQFAQRVRGHYLRSLAFGSIAVAKLKAGDIDGAIDAALEVKDPKWGSWLLSEILTKILELHAGGGLKEDIEERARHQRAMWEKH